MSEILTAMRDQMPPELVGPCDEMHADMFGNHAAHHPGTEG